MGRILFVSALLYGWGSPALDGRRPHELERPLRDFHRSVDAAISDGRRTLVMLDDVRTMRYLAALQNAF
jgi:hypothetical protein